MAKWNTCMLCCSLQKQFSYSTKLAPSSNWRSSLQRDLQESEVCFTIQLPTIHQSCQQNNATNSTSLHWLLLWIHFQKPTCGKKSLKGVAESLNYLTSGLSDKSQGKKWHRITHRILTDLHHRSIRRTAAEEWNLALHCDHKDIFAGEFVRTYISAPFNGNILVRRLELFEKNESSMQTLKNLTVRTGKENFHFFDDESQLGFFSRSVKQCHTEISK